MNAFQVKPVILSGPSGAGKSTVVARLLNSSPVPLVPSISATTRSARQGERHGVHYYYLTPEEFHAKRRRGEFLECKEVFGRGDWYGTLQREVEAGLKAGNWVLLEIDVQGAISAREQYPQAVTIFLHPGSLAELETRLRRRGSETEASLARRLEVARQELCQVHQYRYQVVNDSVERAVAEICRILQREAAAAPTGDHPAADPTNHRG
jgi:guanylate kinase